MKETHHPEDCIQGEGEAGDGGAAEVYNWPEGLEVKHSLQGLVGRTTLGVFTHQLTVVHRHCPERADLPKLFISN